MQHENKTASYDEKWLNADLILSVNEHVTETEWEHWVCEDYFHYLHCQGLLMEKPTWGRVYAFVWVCVGNEFIHWSGQNSALFRAGEYDSSFVIYTVSFSPWEL